MFCIVRCDRCGAYQGTLYPISTSKCRACNRTIDIKKHTPLGVFPKEEEMRRRLEAYRSGRSLNEIENAVPSMDDNGIRRLSSMRNREERTKLVLDSIGDGTVTKEELISSLSETGMDQKELKLILNILIEQRMIFEPRTDKLSRVK